MLGKRRVVEVKDNETTVLPIPEPGEYYCWRGVWHAMTPNGALANLGNHEVTEHEDGTISVKPSILCDGVNRWHGYLERGVWRECE